MYHQNQRQSFVIEMKVSNILVKSYILGQTKYIPCEGDLLNSGKRIHMLQFSIEYLLR